MYKKGDIYKLSGISFVIVAAVPYRYAIALPKTYKDEALCKLSKIKKHTIHHTSYHTSYNKHSPGIILYSKAHFQEESGLDEEYINEIWSANLIVDD